MNFFTSDEHYLHNNIIKYCNRPYKNKYDMTDAIISNHNEVVKSNDIVYHGGDFGFGSPKKLKEIIDKLNGRHIFIHGSHDKDLTKLAKKDQIDYRGRRVEIIIKNKFIVIDHYCLRVWPRSHYNSWHLFGHSHGTLEPVGKSWDIGVDNNNFYPLSFDQIVTIMEKRPDNFNFIPEDTRRQ